MWRVVQNYTPSNPGIGLKGGKSCYREYRYLILITIEPFQPLDMLLQWIGVEISGFKYNIYTIVLKVDPDTC